MEKSFTEHLTYFAKLFGTYTWNFVKCNFLGALSTVLVLILGLFALSNQINVGKSGHVSAIPFLTLAAATKPFTVIPFYLITLISPYLLFVFSGSYATTKVINKLLHDKKDSALAPFLDKTIDAVQAKQPGLFKAGTDMVKSQMKMIAEVKKSDQNRIVKLIINYALSKISLDDVDLSGEEASYTVIIREKILEKLHEVSEPSFRTFWIVVGLQWLILALMTYTNY